MFFSKSSNSTTCAVTTTDATTTATAKTTIDMPLFLFAGQSNMQGNIDPALFDQIVKILISSESEPVKKKNIEAALNHWYLTYSDGYAKYAYDPQVSTLEANAVVGLHKNGIIDANFPNPPKNNTAYCTDSTSAATPVATNCGNTFGPELIFSREYAHKTTSPFTVVKVVEGGTTLAVDWISPSASNGHPGPMYKQLAARIASLKSNPKSIHADCATGTCAFKAFVWFQGENDSMDENYANAYANNLKHFIQDVRTLLGDPNFPVVIVQIGFWPTTLAYGSTVIQAQADFVKNTPHTTLVTTMDLSHYFHFDPAAQMIIGKRVEAAVETVAPTLKP